MHDSSFSTTSVLSSNSNTLLWQMRRSALPLQPSSKPSALAAPLNGQDLPQLTRPPLQAFPFCPSASAARNTAEPSTMSDTPLRSKRCPV
ncbi:hypothetical protein ACFX15_013046 [Malus domestica]